MAQDLYAILGVSRDATEDEIKKAFRKKARELHPDINKAPDAEDRFKELNEAYDVLSDPRKKAQYDRFGSVGSGVGGGAGAGYVDLEDLFGGGFGMGDLFSTFFGGGAGGGRATRQRREGRDMGVGIRITLQQAATGYHKEIAYDRLAPCPDCDGTGLGPDGKEITCPECHGTGRVTSVQHTFLGDMQTSSTCPQCGGSGETIENPCPECDGQGRIPDRQRIPIDIPAGIHDQQKIRISGYGEAGIRGASAGDLVITVSIEEDEFFERQGDDLHCSIQISMIQASLGAELEIEGILEDETVTIPIPEGCQYGQVIKVKDYGMPRYNNSSDRGNLYVHTEVRIPERLSKSEREILEKLAQEMGEEVSDRRSPLQKLRDAFN